MALAIVACSQALAYGWRLGASATEWAELFAEGCAAAERAGDLAALVKLNATYGAVRGLNQGIATDYVHYAGEAVRIADRTGDAALRCGTRGSLLFAYEWSGQLRERGARKRRSYYAGSRRSTLGRAGGGFQSLTGRTCSVRQRCIGFHA